MNEDNNKLSGEWNNEFTWSNSSSAGFKDINNEVLEIFRVNSEDVFNISLDNIINITIDKKLNLLILKIKEKDCPKNSNS